VNNYIVPLNTDANCLGILLLPVLEACSDLKLKVLSDIC